MKTDLGQDAKVLSWTVSDFTKPGDNFATVVTSIKVKALVKDEEKNLSYVVKLNPCRESVQWSAMVQPLFIHEISFFTEIGPCINGYLKNQQPLRVPKCYYSTLEPGKELMINNDLRENGFKMFNKKYGMDYNHATLVIKELAKMHAGSYLLIKERSYDKVLSDFPALKEDVMFREGKNLDMFDDMIQNQVDLLVSILMAFPGYERVTNWMKEWKSKFMKIIQDLISDYTDPFRVINHGDCWNNNFVFRYV